MTKSFLPPENERMFPQKDDRVKRNKNIYSKRQVSGRYICSGIIPSP